MNVQQSSKITKYTGEINVVDEQTSERRITDTQPNQTESSKTKNKVNANENKDKATANEPSKLCVKVFSHSRKEKFKLH